MSFWDFGGISSLVSGPPPSDFGADQTFKAMENQFAQMLQSFMGQYKSESDSIWGQVQNNVLGSIGKYRNSMVLSLNSSGDRLRNNIQSIEAQQAQEQEGSLSTIINTVAGGIAGVAAYLATVQAELEQITYTGGHYIGDLMGKTDYIGMRAGQMVNDYLESGGKISDLYTWVNPTMREYGSIKEGFQWGGDEILTGFRQVLTEMGKSIQEGAETEAGRVFGEVGIAQASMSTLAGIGLLLGSMLSIPGDSMAPTQEQIDAAIAQYQIEQSEAIQENMGNLEMEAETHLVGGKTTEETVREKMQSDFMKSITTALMNGGNLQATLINEINKWLQSGPGRFGGDSGESGAISDLVGLVSGFGGFF